MRPHENSRGITLENRVEVEALAAGGQFASEYFQKGTAGGENTEAMHAYATVFAQIGTIAQYTIDIYAHGVQIEELTLDFPEEFSSDLVVAILHVVSDNYPSDDMRKTATDMILSLIGHALSDNTEG
jgi:hypothetical protein